MPIGAAELAVGRAFKAEPFLELHHLADRFILDGLELIRRDGVLLPLVARIEQLLRTQETANVIGTERRCGTRGHGSSSVFADGLVQGPLVLANRSLQSGAVSRAILCPSSCGTYGQRAWAPAHREWGARWRSSAPDVTSRIAKRSAKAMPRFWCSAIRSAPICISGMRRRRYSPRASACCATTCAATG